MPGEITQVGKQNSKGCGGLAKDLGTTSTGGFRLTALQTP